MDRKKHLYGKKDVGRKKHLDSKERLDCKTHVELAIGLAHPNMVVGGRMAAKIGPTRIHGMNGGIVRMEIGGLGMDVSGAAATTAGLDSLSGSFIDL